MKILNRQFISNREVKLVDEGKTFGQQQYFVYIDNRHFGESVHTLKEADAVFRKACTQAVSLKV